MSKAKVTTSNVQDDLIKGLALLKVPIESVIPDPDRPNIRGRVVDTTDLQPSIREHGILQPVLVRPVPGEPDLYYRISGERRQVAARAVGLKEIPVIVGYDLENRERDIRRLMLASSLHKSEPHIVLDSEGNVIAGKCRAVYEELSDPETELTRQDLADDLGVSADIVGAYFCLYTDIPEIQQKVAKGQMAITVYSLVKHHGEELKRYLAEKKGQVSANYVRKTLKDWSSRIEPKLQAEAEETQLSMFDEDDVLDMETSLEPQPHKTETISLKVTRKMTVTQLLNGAFDNLNKIVLNDGRLTGTDWTVVERIEATIGRIKDAD